MNIFFIALRQARRDRQLISKRLLQNEDEVSMETGSSHHLSPEQVRCVSLHTLST